MPEASYLVVVVFAVVVVFVVVYVSVDEKLLTQQEMSHAILNN